jgi:hypothetical protein
VEKLTLFPGWAVRRYSNDGVLVKQGVSNLCCRFDLCRYLMLSVSLGDVQRFTVDVFVSGFASSLRTPEQATRSQRAFMRLARGEFCLVSKSGAKKVDRFLRIAQTASTSPEHLGWRGHG